MIISSKSLLLLTIVILAVKSTVLDDYKTITFSTATLPYFEVIAKPAYPLYWNGYGENHVVYLELEQGKGLVFDATIGSGLFAATSQVSWFQKWRDILFGGASQNFKEVVADLDSNTGDWAILIYKNSPRTNWQGLIDLWKTGKTGPLMIMDYGNTDLARSLGYRFKKYTSKFVERKMPELTWETISIGGLIEGYTQDLNLINEHDIDYDPSSTDEKSRILANFKTLGDTIFNFLLSVQDDFGSIVGKLGYSYKGKYNMTQAATILKLSMSQSLALIDTEKYKQLKNLFGSMYGLRSGNDLVEPKLVDIRITMRSMFSMTTYLGLYSLPHSQFFIQGPNPYTGNLLIGPAYDTLFHKSVTKRVPLAHHMVFLFNDQQTSQYGFSPIGGPMGIQITDYSTNFQIEFKGVALVPGININDAASFIRWDHGYFNNTRLAWAELYCDSLYLTFYITKIETLSSKELIKMCVGIDRVNKAMFSFRGKSYWRRELMQVQFEPNPAYGAAHAGRPIVCPSGWIGGVFASARALDGSKQSGWGLLHEIGHNHQYYYFTTELDGEVTNNVLVLLVYTYLYNLKYEDRKFHPNVYRQSDMAKYINTGDDNVIHNFWRRLIYYYTVATDFGFGAISRTWTRMTEGTDFEFLKQLGLVSGLNTGAYGLLMRTLTESQAVALSNELPHYRVYKPVGHLTPEAFDRWPGIQKLLNFTDSTPGSFMGFGDYTNDWYMNDPFFSQTVLKTYD